MKIRHEISQYVAEFIGTFFMVFFGCGAMVMAELDPAYNGSLVPLIFGGAVSIMIYATGHISGAHFNPAVTMAFWSTGRFPAKRIPGYVLAQFFGASAVSLSHRVIWGLGHGFGKTVISTGLGSGFFIEVLLSFVLMFVIISVATDSRAVGELAGIAIGSTVALCAFVGGPLTSASMNPARTLGPAILSLDFSNFWIYLLAPCLGTVFGAWTYEWIRCQKKDDLNKIEEKHGCC